MLRHLRESQPNVIWRSEHDLSRIPDDAACYELGQVIGRIWDGSGPLPMTFRVERGEEGDPTLKRCLVNGEPDSELFLLLHRRQICVANDLIAEAEAASSAGARHHTGWLVKAIDVVLAQVNLGLASFQAGEADWREVLTKPRPEFDPRYEVSSDLPIGF